MADMRPLARSGTVASMSAMIALTLSMLITGPMARGKSGLVLHAVSVKCKLCSHNLLGSTRDTN